MKKTALLCILLMVQGVVFPLRAQQTTVVEEKLPIRTYPFSQPDPVPILLRHRDIYPYFAFREYGHSGTEMEWNVVRIENDYIRVLILPESGGKVFGASEKSTNRDFIYQNDVMKFRQVAMRGPWTSGGIEFNFGLVGHAPSTATPVNYIIREKPDGSRSCVVGTYDLPSRTRWSVEISVPPNGAFFSIRPMWTNPTPFHQSYYAWMNNAIRASEDLQYFYPGNRRRFHGYDAPMNGWPMEGKRDISWYKHNDFGSHHSHFIMGEYAEYYGGYWHDARFGFGHWARYDDMPGKKIWIWALSREGAIWEQLLTDTKGQYSEPQSGRYLSQDDHEYFAPYTTDTWEEILFPYKEIGGMVDASKTGVLNVSISEDSLFLGVCALQPLHELLSVRVGGDTLHAEILDLKPMEFMRRSMVFSGGRGVQVNVGNDLSYTDDPTAGRIERPIDYHPVDTSTTEGLFRAAAFDEKRRRFNDAAKKYSECLRRESDHLEALTRLAELHARRGNFETGLRLISRALALSMYDPAANYVYGVICRALNRLTDAKETLGWAARSMAYRSNAYSQMAEIALLENDTRKAAEYTRRALDFNTYNLRAYEISAVTHRMMGNIAQASSILDQLMEKDPLNPIARYEKVRLNPSQEGWKSFQNGFQTEIPHETFIETALFYVKLGQVDEALHLLSMSPDTPMVHFWAAYLERETHPEASSRYLSEGCSASPYFVFPFRLESIPVLEWVIDQKPDEWKPKYYLGLLLWSKGRTEEADGLFSKCGDPDFAPFHIVMSHFEPEQQLKHFKRAQQIDPDDWTTVHRLIQAILQADRPKQALKLSRKAARDFPDKNVIALDLAYALFHNAQYESCLSVLDTLEILPYEGGWEAHHLYMRAHIYHAMERMTVSDYHSAITHLDLSKGYPEHLGTGKPYDSDTRLQDYLIAVCYDSLDHTQRALSFRKKITDYTIKHWESNRKYNVFGLLTLERSGDIDRVNALKEAWQETYRAGRWYLAHRSGQNESAKELVRLNERDPRFKLVYDTVCFIERLE